MDKMIAENVFWLFSNIKRIGNDMMVIERWKKSDTCGHYPWPKEGWDVG